MGAIIKKLILIVLGLFIIFGDWYLFTGQITPSVHLKDSLGSKNSGSIYSTNRRLDPALIDLRPQVAKLNRAVPAAMAATAPSSLVEFKVVDGLAVTFDDILLGTPDSSEVKVGHYQMPAVQLWNTPEIPYAINSNLPNPERVEWAVHYLKEHTPINFVPYQGQPDAIIFEVGSSNCLSALGRIGGIQPIKLSTKCSSQNVLHEMMHALGFVHEQSRPDRDEYLTIIWDNIDQEYRSQFAMVSEDLMEAEKNSVFDYHSVMLYNPMAFSAQPGETVMRTRSQEPISPTTQGLSPGDIQRLNRLYGS